MIIGGDIKPSVNATIQGSTSTQPRAIFIYDICFNRCPGVSVWHGNTSRLVSRVPGELMLLGFDYCCYLWLGGDGVYSKEKFHFVQNVGSIEVVGCRLG